LDARSREISIISILIALRVNIPLGIDMHGALNVGLTRKGLIEGIVQSSIYAGHPAAVNAVEIAREVFRERDQKEKQSKQQRSKFAQCSPFRGILAIFQSTPNLNISGDTLPTDTLISHT
jgi:hypothetical protein